MPNPPAGLTGSATEGTDRAHADLAGDQTGASLLLGNLFGSRPMDQYRTKADLVADTLRRAIASGRIKRGQRLRFSELTDELGVSATPIREALRILATEGLVSLESHKEIRVTEFTADDALEVYQLRSMLESLATRQAVPQVTSEQLAILHNLNAEMKRRVDAEDLEGLPELNARWHHMIYAAADAKYLHFMIEKLWAWFPWDIWLIPDRACKTVDEHEGILDAFDTGDADKAAVLMEEHILSGRSSVVDHLRQASRATAD